MNNQLADVPIIIGSIDPCFSCTDRMVLVDMQSGKAKEVSGTELEELSRQLTTGR